MESSIFAKNAAGPWASESERAAGTTSTPPHAQPSLDMESLLRQWGGSPSEADAVEAVAAPPPPPAEGGGAGPPLLGRSHSAAGDRDDREEGSEGSEGSPHRRIASTGGGRLLVPPSPSSLPPDDPPPGPDSGGAELHDAARITNWALVASLSRSPRGPSLAGYRGPDGWTALHHACSRRCPDPDVVEALLRAHPSALTWVDDRGWTPLHHACRFKAPRSVVRLLLRAHPSMGSRAARIRCGAGRSALYYSMRYDAPSGVPEMLLEADPKAVLDEDRDGLCPLGYVWDGYANGFGGRRDLKALLRKFEEPEGARQLPGGLMGQQQRGVGERLSQQRGEELKAAEKRARDAVLRSENPALKTLQSKWKVVNNLLRAYFRFPLNGAVEGEEMGDDSAQLAPDGERAEKRTEKKRKWRILHAVSAIKCHHTLFLLARALHPEQASEIDDGDLFPSDSNAPRSSEKPASRRTALHFAASSPLSGKDSRLVLKTLLALHPSSPSLADGRGSLPLHLMAENDAKVHWVRDGFRDVCECHPGALVARDGEGRTPLHCAAAAGRCGSAAAPPSPAGGAQQQPVDHAAPEPRDFDAAARNAASVVLNLVLLNPAAASVPDDSGRLPLHYVAERGEEWNNDAQSVLTAYPAAARQRAGKAANSMLPLHMAASNPDARPSLVMNVVNANPRAASLTDGRGRLPLHMAVDSGRTAWDRGIESIYDAYNAAVSTREDAPRAWTVLHTASASHSAGCHLIESILNLNPAAASLADGEGRYPLHLACAAGRRWEEGGVRILFKADPAVALMEDASGLLPFHIVAMKSSAASPSSAAEGAAGNDSQDSLEGETITNNNNTMEGNTEEDLASLEVLFNLLIAQPSTIRCN